MKNILVPVGSSENGINNLKYAINFASISGGNVYLININKEYARIGGIKEVDQFELYKSGKLLSNIINSVNAKGIKVITKPIKGDPFVAIKKISTYTPCFFHCSRIISLLNISMKKEALPG